MVTLGFGELLVPVVLVVLGIGLIVGSRRQVG
jgi:hypothetical protein